MNNKNMHNFTLDKLLNALLALMLVSVSVNTFAFEMNNHIKSTLNSVKGKLIKQVIDANSYQCTPTPKKRWQIQGESLKEGDIITLTLGGFSMSYTDLVAIQIPVMTYSNELLGPNIHISDGRGFSLYFTNRMDENISVRAMMYDSQRNLLNPKHYLNLPFSVSNDPINNFATLNARAVSRIYFNNSMPIEPAAQMIIKWTSPTCLYAPLSITVSSGWSDGKAHGFDHKDYGPF